MRAMWQRKRLCLWIDGIHHLHFMLLFNLFDNDGCAYGLMEFIIYTLLLLFNLFDNDGQTIIVICLIMMDKRLR